MMTQAQTSPQQPGAVFASEFATEHNTPPFSLIGNADYEPAISAGIEKARKELADIASNPEAPTSTGCSTFSSISSRPIPTTR